MVWDNLLNELWSVLQDNLSPEIMDGLLTEQREWIAEKEAEVKKAAAEVGGGSMASMVAKEEKHLLYRTRFL